MRTITSALSKITDSSKVMVSRENLYLRVFMELSVTVERRDERYPGARTPSNRVGLLYTDVPVSNLSTSLNSWPTVLA